MLLEEEAIWGSRFCMEQPGTWAPVSSGVDASSRETRGFLEKSCSSSEAKRFSSKHNHFWLRVWLLEWQLFPPEQIPQIWNSRKESPTLGKDVFTQKLLCAHPEAVTSLLPACSPATVSATVHLRVCQRIPTKVLSQ